MRHTESSEHIEGEPGRAVALDVSQIQTAKAFIIVAANVKETRNVMALHHLQIPGGIGLMLSKSNPTIERPKGKMEFVSKSRNRSLSAGDHSWTASRRKTTTTPAKPANATAICAAIPRASPGSIVSVLFVL